MKLSVLILFCVVITTNLCAQGVTTYGQSTTTSTNFVDKNGKIGSVQSLNKYGAILANCPSTVVVTHTTGAVSPANITISYGVVTTSISGASKCWITQNIGAIAQPSSASDATAPPDGWYWQFNRMQGYAVGPSPAWTITSINENSNWLGANDPCTLLFGTGWRIPTGTEWTTVTTGWASPMSAYNSVLVLAAAGEMSSTNGSQSSSGLTGTYWSSTSFSNTNSYMLWYNLSGSAPSTAANPKAYGLSLRCLRD